MKQTINKSQFRDAFSRMDRGGQFSYEALGALFDYLESYEEDAGEEMELDVIAICCDWTEYDDLEELQADYSDIETMEDIEDNTQVIQCDNGHIIIQNY